MVGMGTKVYQQSTGSPRAEVGEIDTRAPFQSVKAAVSLFGEGATPTAQPLITRMSKPASSEQRVLDKETQLHLTEKELSKLKEQLKNAENTKAKAHFDLEKAKRTLQDLTKKLKSVTESKKSATETTEAAKNRAKQLEEAHSQIPLRSPTAWRQELDHARDQYKTASNELAIVKQELRKIQQDFDSFLEAKIVAFQQAADAQHAVKMNRERVNELSKDIAAMQESLGHVKLATLQAQEERTKIMTERDAHQQSHRTAMEETERKLLSLKKELDPEPATNLEEKLAETTAEIAVLQEEVKTARAISLDSARILNLELADAQKALQNVTEEQSSLQSLVDSLGVELQNVKKDFLKLEEKAAEGESVAGNLQTEVEKSKTELQAALAEENKAAESSDEMISTLLQLSSESKHARQEVEEIEKKIEELKREADAAQIVVKEAEEKLQDAVAEIQEARAAEKTAHDQIKIKTLYQNKNAAPALNSEADAKIKLSAEDFESLTRKVEESENLAQKKVAAAMAEVEAIRSRENEAVRKLEESLREIEAIKATTEEALKKAEMADAAKMAVEGELKKWRQEEEKQASDVDFHVLEIS